MFPKVLLHLLLPIFFLLVHSDATFGQFHKLWEFTLEGNGYNPISYNINTGAPLRTFRTADGEFIVVSLIEEGPAFYPSKIYVYRFDSQGNVKWQYTYQSDYDIKEDIYDACIDIFGNIIVSGNTTTYYSGGFEPVESSNSLLLKISPEGNLIWKYESPLPPYNALQRCISVSADDQGNVYSASTVIDQPGSGGVMAVEKWKANGDLLWRQTLPYSYTATLRVIDSLVIILFPPTPSRIFHFSLDGDLLFSGEIPKVSAKTPLFDQDGNWYSLRHTGKFLVEKRNIYGDILWEYQKPSNLPPNVLADEIEDCTVDPFGNVFITGRHYGPHYGDTSLYSNCDILTVKLNQHGEYQWENRYQYTDLRSCQVGQRIQVDLHGQVFVTGYQSVRQGGDPYYSSDMILLAYDAFGNRTDSTYYDGVFSQEDNGVNLLLEDDAIYVLGWTQQQDSLYDQVVIKYEKPLVNASRYNTISGDLKLFPNPVTGAGVVINCEASHVHIELSDLIGNKILSDPDYDCGSLFEFKKKIPAGHYIITARMPGSIISSGIIISE